MVNKNILVTGATGFVGSHLVDALCVEDNNVTALVRKNSNLRYLSNRKIKILHGDLLDKGSLGPVLENVNIIVHSAALMSDGGNASKNDFYETNVTGTKNLISSCFDKNKPEHFIHISTVGVYGSTGRVPVNERNAYGKGLSNYEWSKAEAEKAVLEYTEKMPVTILRLGQLYGPRMFYGWTNVMEMICKNKMIVIGKGDALIQLTYIDDAVNGIKEAIYNERSKGEIFNICGKDSYKLSEVFKEITEALGRPYLRSAPYCQVYMLACFLKAMPEFLKSKSLRLLTPHRVKFFKDDHIYDIGKAREYFGYNPVFKIHEGVKRMVEWYLSESAIENLCQGGK